MVRVLFVCLGNICRSPMAEAVFRKAVADAGLSHRIAVDSAGTTGYHAGEVPDRRAHRAAKARGVALEGRARRIEPGDFARFDYVLAMDEANLEDLARRCPKEHEGRLGLFLEFAPALGQREVPDPYYGGEQGFERVLNLVEAGARGLLEHIRARHSLSA